VRIKLSVAIKKWQWISMWERILSDPDMKVPVAGVTLRSETGQWKYRIRLFQEQRVLKQQTVKK